jgi:hypothetical protein
MVLRLSQLPARPAPPLDQRDPYTVIASPRNTLTLMPPLIGLSRTHATERTAQARPDQMCPSSMLLAMTARPPCHDQEDLTDREQ